MLGKVHENATVTLTPVGMAKVVTASLEVRLTGCHNGFQFVSNIDGEL